MAMSAQFRKLTLILIVLVFTGSVFLIQSNIEKNVGEKFIKEALQGIEPVTYFEEEFAPHIDPWTIKRLHQLPHNLNERVFSVKDQEYIVRSTDGFDPKIILRHNYGFGSSDLASSSIRYSISAAWNSISDFIAYLITRASVRKSLPEYYIEISKIISNKSSKQIIYKKVLLTNEGKNFPFDFKTPLGKHDLIGMANFSLASNISVPIKDNLMTRFDKSLLEMVFPFEVIEMTSHRRMASIEIFNQTLVADDLFDDSKVRGLVEIYEKPFTAGLFYPNPKTKFHLRISIEADREASNALIENIKKILKETLDREETIQ